MRNGRKYSADRGRRIKLTFPLSDFRFLLPIAAAALLLLIPANASAQSAKAGSGADAAGNIQSGKQKFTSRDCFLCHGSQGQGMLQAGPRIGPPERSFAEFVQFVREPVGDMPPVSSQRVSDSDLTDIYAFLRSMSAPPRASVSVPAGNVQNGKAIFAGNCGQCHGSLGQGLPENGPKVSATSRSLADFIQYTRMPTGNMAPVSVRRVSDAQLADVYAFLQSMAVSAPKQ